jgi:hypothetical protein
MNEEYPLTYGVEYPDRPLNRLTTFFRIFTVIPIFIVLETVSGGSYNFNFDDTTNTTTTFASRADSSSSRRC